MSLLVVVRIFVLTLFFNLFLPSGDVYSDVILMYQTWTFRNTESLEMSGCRACFGKTDEDLVSRSRKHCNVCIWKKGGLMGPFGCASSFKAINKLLELENRNECENSKWRVFMNGTLEEANCDWYGDGHDDGNGKSCCFETRNQTSELNKNCHIDVCKLHLDGLSTTWGRAGGFFQYVCLF